MADFSKSIGYVLANEGGYSNNPNDSGGPTNYGITIGTLRSYLGHEVTAEAVKNLKLSTAELIYQKNYWHPLQLDAVRDQNRATCIFDCGVNMGPRRAVILAQQSTGCPADGIMGPQTLSFINVYANFITDFHNAVKEHYEELVLDNPRNHVFLKGWMNRVDKMLTLND